MARIEALTVDNAPEATKTMLQTLNKNLGMTPKLFATIGQSPEALMMLLGSMEGLAKGGLSKREVEVVNIFTSELNGCAYCVSAHAAIGKGVGLKQPDIDAIRQGRGATPREQAIMNFVRRVIRTGGGGAGTELALIRESGVSDREVIEVLAHVALKAFTNAVALVAQTEIDFPKQPHLPQS